MNKDIQAKALAHIQIAETGEKVWINVDGRCELRVMAPMIVVEDMRPESQPAPQLEPLPDPGDGWRRAEGKDFEDVRCEVWDDGCWVERLKAYKGKPFSNNWPYRIPVDPTPIETLATSYVPSKLQHLQQSQYVFEVVRDIATLMKGMKNGDKVSIEIECRHTHYDWKCDGDNQPCGPSEAATAMRKAYEGVFNRQEQTPTDTEYNKHY